MRLAILVLAFLALSGVSYAQDDNGGNGGDQTTAQEPTNNTAPSDTGTSETEASSAADVSDPQAKWVQDLVKAQADRAQALQELAAAASLTDMKKALAATTAAKAHLDASEAAIKALQANRPKS